ncbi:electron transfer flavoprotein subunit beta [Pseudomonas taeanensis MS-3]|uniref:Electron transfer flavoprotein subunit beta n=1 Tax=Pseudomonas taeanensis MS-3 TaxID=1395571 RepID=A0A0A1YI65_9PSED|nr:electron transfer flavoprotein subunit beta [Pseudomonas taeanensis]KFX69637.1 electron transfer flavoprotein subunit beta [Pseudomonas taeanensis MS-3]
MNILVLLAGVADNRYPLHEIRIGGDGLIAEAGQSRRVLSPFDEGALELALKLRDAREECRIEVLVLGGCNNDNLLRSVAAYKPERVRLLDLQPCCPWDARLSAAQIAGLVEGEALPVDLLLIGREFGDLDEGSLPVLLAARLGLPLFSLAQFAEWQGETVRLLRERGIRQQWHRVAGPLLVTVTNDKRNKLRHPLMKNVMLAKKMTFDTAVAASAQGSALHLAELAAAREVQRGGACRLLDGDVTAQARALATLLRGQLNQEIVP